MIKCNVTDQIINRVENPGEGVAQIFAEISGGSSLSGQKSEGVGGVALFLVVLHFKKQAFRKFAGGGWLCASSPLCASINQLPVI